MPSPAMLALRRSLRVYHGDTPRNARMDALYRRFVAGGDLAFDIGAHVGDRVSSFRRLGCRVVALEPQPLLVRALRLIHGRDPRVTVLQAAAGAREGPCQVDGGGGFADAPLVVDDRDDHENSPSFYPE